MGLACAAELAAGPPGEPIGPEVLPAAKWRAGGRGDSSRRQRSAYARRGRPTDVVDLLVAETAGQAA